MHSCLDFFHLFTMNLDKNEWDKISFILPNTSMDANHVLFLDSTYNSSKNGIFDQCIFYNLAIILADHHHQTTEEYRAANNQIKRSGLILLLAVADESMDKIQVLVDCLSVVPLEIAAVHVTVTSCCGMLAHVQSKLAEMLSTLVGTTNADLNFHVSDNSIIPKSFLSSLSRHGFKSEHLPVVIGGTWTKPTQRPDQKRIQLQEDMNVHTTLQKANEYEQSIMLVRNDEAAIERPRKRQNNCNTNTTIEGESKEEEKNIRIELYPFVVQTEKIALDNSNTLVATERDIIDVACGREKEMKEKNSTTSVQQLFWKTYKTYLSKTKKVPDSSTAALTK